MSLSPYEVFMGPTNRVVTLKLIRYSLLMVLIPLLVFYLSFYVVFEQQKDKLMWCGLLAVFATNVVIASYVIMAWNEKDDQKPKKIARKENRTD